MITEQQKEAWATFLKALNISAATITFRTGNNIQIWSSDTKDCPIVNTIHNISVSLAQEHTIKKIEIHEKRKI